MSKARVQGSSAIIKVKDPFLGFDISIGELDSFSAKSTSSIIKSRPIGHSIETPQFKYGGYDLSFKGGKVDWQLARVMHSQDTLALTIGVVPIFKIEQKINHFDGTEEIYVYNNVMVFGYDLSADGANSDITESVSAFAPDRSSLNFTNGGQDIYGIVNAMIQEASNVAYEAAGNLAGRVASNIGKIVGSY